jgi:hypothetical protein
MASLWVLITDIYWYAEKLWCRRLRIVGNYHCVGIMETLPLEFTNSVQRTEKKLELYWTEPAQNWNQQFQFHTLHICCGSSFDTSHWQQNRSEPVWTSSGWFCCQCHAYTARPIILTTNYLRITYIIYNTNVFGCARQPRASTQPKIGLQVPFIYPAAVHRPFVCVC